MEKDGIYRPLSLSFTQTTATLSTYTAEVINGTHAALTLPGTLSSVSSVRFYSISEKSGGSAFTNGQITLNYGSDDEVTDASVLRIAKDNGSGAWLDLGGIGSAPTTGTINSTETFTSFGDFILAKTKVETLSLTALLEAMYVAGGSAMLNPADVTVELHDASTLLSVESKTATLSTAGVGTFMFTTTTDGTPYYIVLKSPTTVETWSAVTHSFSAGALSYNFTTGLGQAYTDGSMDPMALHNGKYCIYSGDVSKELTDQ